MVRGVGGTLPGLLVPGPVMGVSVVGVSLVPDELPGRVIVTDPHAARASAIARTVATRTEAPGRVVRRDDIHGKATPGFCEAHVNPAVATSGRQHTQRLVFCLCLDVITLGQRDGYERRARFP